MTRLSKLPDLLIIVCSTLVTISETSDDLKQLEIRLVNYSAPINDDYVCTGKRVEKPSIYITKFIPSGNLSRIHHMILFGCFRASTEIQRNCDMPCLGASMLYAWANEAPSLTLPDDVSFAVGRRLPVRYLVVQVHFKDAFPDEKDTAGIDFHYTETATKFEAGIIFFAPQNFRLSPNRKAIRVAWQCTLRLYAEEITVFASRVHGHAYSRTNSAFFREEFNHNWTKIVERSTHRPQAFYLLEQPLQLNDGWEAAGRCVFNTKEATSTVFPGKTEEDEMCNIYLMYYVEMGQAGFTYCVGRPRRFYNLPVFDRTEFNVPVGDSVMAEAAKPTTTTTTASPKTTSASQPPITDEGSLTATTFAAEEFSRSTTSQEPLSTPDSEEWNRSDELPPMEGVLNGNNNSDRGK